MIEQIFQYEFLSNAVWASILTAIACGIVGTYIVSKRIVFIAGGITHASFGGIGIGFFMGWNPILSALGFSVLVAWAIQYFSKRTNLREDSVIATLWALGMALGILFVYLTPGYTPNLMSYLFGSILTVSHFDLWLMLVVVAVIILFFIFFYRSILYISFDENFARTKTNYVNLFNYILISLTALVIVINIRVVGIILVLSLISIPQNTANLFFHRFQHIMWVSIGINLVATLTGLWISYQFNIPSGATIIIVLVVIFILAKVGELISKKIKLSEKNNL